MGRERVVERFQLVRSGREVEVVDEGEEKKGKAGDPEKETMRTKLAVSGLGESLRASDVLAENATWSRERV